MQERLELLEEYNQWRAIQRTTDTSPEKFLRDRDQSRAVEKLERLDAWQIRWHERIPGEATGEFIDILEGRV